MKKLMFVFIISLALLFSLFPSKLNIVSANNLAEPLGFEDDLRFCAGIFDSLDGRSYVTMQTNTSSVNRSLQWTLQIRSSAHKLFTPKVNVSLSGSVNNLNINSPYAPHYEVPSYSFHGSMKTYQVSGKNYSLKSGDIVSFKWVARNPTKINNTNHLSVVLLECKVR